MSDSELSVRALRSRGRILDALTTSGGSTRAQLVSDTGLASSSVAATVAALLGSGQIVETTPAATPGRGRRPSVLRAVAREAHVIGIDIGHRHIAVAVADHEAVVAAEARELIDVDHRPAATLDLVGDMVRATLGAAGLSIDEIDGIAACLPSTLDADHVRSSGSWPGPANVDRELARRIGHPITLINDADAGLLGESRFGAARGIRDLIYVKAAHGLGAAFLFDGRPYRGSTGLSGEIGHIRLPTSEAGPNAPWCRCGNQGCLETVLSLDEIESRLAWANRHRTADRPATRPAEDMVATRMLLENGRSLGRVLADLSTALNPTMIVIGGELAMRADKNDDSPLVLGVRESIGQYALPVIAEHLDVRPAELGTRSELLGTVALALASPMPAEPVRH